MWVFACACVCARLCVPSALCALIVLECNWCAQSLIALMKTTCECHYFSSCVCSLSLSLSLCLSVCPSIGLSIGAHLLPLCASVYTSTSTKNDRVACGAYVVHKCSGAAAHVRSGASRIGAVMLTYVVVLGWGHIYIYISIPIVLGAGPAVRG